MSKLTGDNFWRNLRKSSPVMAGSSKVMAVSNQYRILVHTPNASTKLIFSHLFGSISELKGALQDRLDLPMNEHRLLIRDKDFNEFVDLEYVNEVQNNSVLKIVKRNDSIEQPTSQEGFEASALSSESNSSADSDTSQDQSGQWPKIFPIPDLFDEARDPIVAALMRECMKGPEFKEQVLNRHKPLKGYILTAVIKVIWRYTQYPRGTQLAQVAQQLVAKYPVLKHRSGDGWEAWTKNLQDKVSNFRRFMARAGCNGVLANKRKRNGENFEESSAHKGIIKARRGEVNYRPDYLPGEDEISSLRCRDSMLIEIRRLNCDERKIRDLMSLTFALRRSNITDKFEDENNEKRLRHVYEILPFWPALSIASVAEDEFFRLTAIRLRNVWFDNLDRLSDPIINHCKRRKTGGELDKNVTGYIAEHTDALMRKRCRALFSVSLFFNEEISQYCRFYEQGTPLSQIIPSDDTDAGTFIAVIKNGKQSHNCILIQKEILMENVDEFAEAVMFLMAYHYIFDLQYCAPLTLEFLQRSIVKAGLMDKKPNVRMSSFLTAIHAY